MVTITKAYPQYFKATAEDRINYLTYALSLLRDHIREFGEKIKDEDVKAYKFILNNIQLIEKELQIRKDYS